MQKTRFDRLARAIAAPTTRRRTVAWLSMLGMTSTAPWFSEADAKKKHKKKKRKKCKPRSPESTCAGKCGTVKNNCKKSVECGTSCDDGHVCVDGACETCGLDDDPCCPDNSCAFGRICLAGTCQSCGFSEEPCCAGDTCELGDLACFSGTCHYCGFTGELCCPGNDCTIGTCVAGECQ